MRWNGPCVKNNLYRQSTFLIKWTLKDLFMHILNCYPDNNKPILRLFYIMVTGMM